MILTKNKGFLFLTTLNKTYLSYVLGILVAESVLKLVPPGTHDWNKFLTPNQISQILENSKIQSHLLILLRTIIN